MSVVKINSYIDVTVTTEAEAIALATIYAEAIDSANAIQVGSNVVTKVYYICPLAGRIIVAVSEADRVLLREPSAVIASTEIANYALERIPSSIIDYKELVIRRGETITAEQIANTAQYIAEEAAAKSFPFKMPVVKVVNYNVVGESTFVLPSVFGTAIFRSLSGISNSGGTVVYNNDHGGHTITGGTLLDTGFYSTSDGPVEYGSFPASNYFKANFKLEVIPGNPISNYVWAKVTKPDGSSVTYKGTAIRDEHFYVMYEHGVGLTVTGVWKEKPVFADGDMISIVIGPRLSTDYSSAVKAVDWYSELRFYALYEDLPIMVEATVTNLSGTDENGNTPAVLFDGIIGRHYYNARGIMRMTVESDFRVWTYVATGGNHYAYDPTLVFMKHSTHGEVSVTNTIKGNRPTPGWYLSSDVMPAGTYRIYGDVDSSYGHRLDHEWFVEAV